MEQRNQREKARLDRTVGNAVAASIFAGVVIVPLALWLGLGIRLCRWVAGV